MTESAPNSSNKTVGVDTNILINFGNFRRLDWKALFPDAASVTVLVSAKVQSEMDHHKDYGAGYVRKRAKEFQTVVRAAEDMGYEVSFDDSEIPVRCVLLDRPQNSVLDSEQFDLADPDELIVAQYNFAAQTWGSLIVVANDASPIRAAKRAGMSALRPDQWTADRSVPEDETTRALRERTRELERIVGARPKVALKDVAADGCGGGMISFAGDFDYAAFQDEMRARLTDRINLPTRSDLVRKFGRRGPDYGFAANPLWSGIGETELDAWAEKLHEFRTHFDRITEDEMRNRIGRLSRFHLLEIALENEGEAPDRNICVDMEIRGNARFFSPHDLKRFNDWALKKPEPPSLDSWAFPELSALLPQPKQDDHSFYRIKRTEVEESHRCAIFMQRQAATIRACVIAKDDDPPPSVLVTIRAQHLLDPVVRELALVSKAMTLDWGSIRALILDRLTLMPNKQAEILRTAFEGD